MRGASQSEEQPIRRAVVFDGSWREETPHFIVTLTTLGGLHGTVVRRLSGNQKDMGLNPTTVRKQTMDIGRPPAQKVC